MTKGHWGKESWVQMEPEANKTSAYHLSLLFPMCLSLHFLQ